MAEEQKKAQKKPAGKGAQRGSKKTGPVGAGSGTGRQQAKPKAVPVRTRSGWSPLAVLTIMALATAVLIMANRFYSSRQAIEKKAPVTAVQKEAPAIRPAPQVIPPPPSQDKKDDVKAVTEKSVKVYFIRLNEKTEKFYLASVARKVKGDALLRETLDELIRGPKRDEENRGYLTAVPGTLKIRKLSLSDRTAVIDFNGAIEAGAAGNILIHRIDQIVYTATQFDTIDSVVIMVDGKRRNSLGGDGLSISGPLHRRQ